MCYYYKAYAKEIYRIFGGFLILRNSKNKIGESYENSCDKLAGH